MNMLGWVKPALWSLLRRDPVADSMDLILKSLANQNALSRETRRQHLAYEQRLTDIEHRLESFRREMLHEPPASARSARGTPRTSGTYRVRNQATFEVARDELRINLGCGYLPLAGYINVDARDLPGVDVVADARDLPCTLWSVTEIYSAHLLEHFTIDDLRRNVLPYWISLLKPGGHFRAIVGDADETMRTYLAGGMSFEELRAFVFGAQAHRNDLCYTMFSAQSLCDLIRESGLTHVTIVAAGRRNGGRYEIEVDATCAET
jgi:hypothetical protein